jgi:riboflavin synthase
MFTGLIEEVGTVVAMRASGGGARLQIAAPRTAKELRNAESIAVNGCCLTLTSRRGDVRDESHHPVAGFETGEPIL